MKCEMDSHGLHLLISEESPAYYKGSYASWVLEGDEHMGPL